MKLVLSLGACLILLATGSGCCCTQRQLCAGDPCAGELAGGGCCLRKLFHHGSHCGCGKHKGCCPTPDCHAMPGCGAPMMSGDCCAPMMPAGDCGCAVPDAHAAPLAPAGQLPRSAMPNIVPPPMTDPAPAPIPNNTPGAITDPAALPSIPATDVPAPPPTTNWKPNEKKSPQLVSYEEFQRLPGQVTSAPAVLTQPAAAPMVTPAQVVPALPMVTPAASFAPAASWVPAGSN